MPSSALFTLRPANIDDVPLFYGVIDRTMHKFIMTAQGTGAKSEFRIQPDGNNFNLKVVVGTN